MKSEIFANENINEVDLTEGGTTTTSQIVKKVFDLYAEDWLQRHQDQQIVEILDRLEDLSDQIRHLQNLVYVQAQLLGQIKQWRQQDQEQQK